MDFIVATLSWINQNTLQYESSYQHVGTFDQ